jgi:hypothetical protein
MNETRPHASTTWVLGPKDCSLPDCYKRIAPSVVRLTDDPQSTSRSTLLDFLFDWDRTRAEGGSNKLTGEARMALGALLCDQSRVTRPVIVSACRHVATALVRGSAGSIYWLEIDGRGATESDAMWRAWINNEEAIQVALHEVTANQDSVVGTAEIRVSRVSPAVTQLHALLAATSLVVKALGAGRPERPRSIGGSTPDRPLKARPSALGVAGRLVQRRIKAKLSPELRGQWMIATARRDSSGLGRSGSLLPDPSAFTWIDPPADGFIADPFLQKIGSSTVLFYEDARTPSWRGVLKAVSLDSSGHPCGPHVTILERPHHLSFPNTFYAQGGAEWLYLLPEQAEHGTTVLYRSPARALPSELAFSEYRVLLPDLAGTDPVLHWEPPYWYLFVSDGQYGNHDNNLLLFFSERLEGPYAPHPGNPVRLGLRGSRMAGQLFWHNGRLIRPGQDCTARYGSGVILYAVECLRLDHYREAEVSTLEPEDFRSEYIGLHTISLGESLVAIDALRYAKF